MSTLRKTNTVDNIDDNDNVPPEFYPCDKWSYWIYSVDGGAGDITILFDIRNLYTLVTLTRADSWRKLRVVNVCSCARRAGAYCKNSSYQGRTYSTTIYQPEACDCTCVIISKIHATPIWYALSGYLDQEKRYVTDVPDSKHIGMNFTYIWHFHVKSIVNRCRPDKLAVRNALTWFYWELSMEMNKTNQNTVRI